MTSDAVTLFVERARAVRPGFGIFDEQTADAVIRICATLDGLPLGIELAAARMAAMSAVEVCDRLGDRFRLLTGPELGPDRQATLRHAVAWSYDLLDDDERATLRTASVFAGGFDLPALCAVAEAGDDVEVLRLLDSLVRKSLVIAHHGSARTRYSLFETIRAFADERLAETDEREAARDRHAAYFAGEAVRRWERWNGPEWRTQVDWVQTELANLRSAYRWSLDRGQVETATDVAAHAALMGFSVELFETIGWAEAVLPAAERADVRRLPRLYAAAGYACFVGRAEVATANAHRATELEGRPGYESCEPGYATFIEALGQVYCGNLDRYVELTREVAALPGRGQAYGIAAYVDGLQSSGRVEEALELTESAVDGGARPRQPLLAHLHAVDRGAGLLEGGPAARPGDLGRGRRLPRRARRAVLRGLPVPRRRPPAHLGRPAGDGADPLRHLDRGVPALRRRGPAGHLAGQPAGPVRAARPSRRRAHPARRDGPRAGELPPRARRSPISVSGSTAGSGRRRRSGSPPPARAMDVRDAAAYALHQIDLARQALDGRRPARRGAAGLTARETQVLRLIADGATTREISERLFISAKTADNHIQHIYIKLGVTNRAAATRWALDHEVVVRRRPTPADRGRLSRARWGPEMRRSPHVPDAAGGSRIPVEPADQGWETRDPIGPDQRRRTTMILATTKVKDLDHFLEVFGTKGADKRGSHGSKGSTVYRDPIEEDRVWAVFDWDEDGWTAFATDPETPGIMQEAGHLGRPSLGQFLGTFNA